MIERVINMDEVDVSYNHVHYVCYGLGSCIGLFVTDRVKKISAAAHIAMPTCHQDGLIKGAGCLINTMFELLNTHGSDLNSLRAKVAGGAHVINGSLGLGAQITEEVIQQLIENRIYVAGIDVGGNISRTARFNTVTGELSISTSEYKTYSI